MFAHFKKIASCNSMTRYPQIKEEPFSFGVLENWLMLGRDAPALRPLHPRSCRKRAFRQGQALRSRFAGDGEEASDGGPVKGSSQRRDTRATIQKQVPHISRFSPIPARCGHDTCKLATAYASQSLPMRTSLPPARRSAVRSVMYIMPPMLKAGYRLSGFP